MSFPNLFVVGVAKAGTSSLHEMLNQHPEIGMSSVKEPHFFSDANATGSLDNDHAALVKDENEYLKLFDNSRKYRGESSPSYFWQSEIVANRIHERCVDPKIIVLLRDPIMRAFSHYHMDFTSNREPATNFLEALKDDVAREKKGWGVSRLYEELGYYADGMRNYRACFGKENVMMLNYETFFLSPENIQEVWSFLGLDPLEIDEMERKNATLYLGLAGRLIKGFGLNNLVGGQLKQMFKKIFSSDVRPSKKEIDYLAKVYGSDILSQRDMGYPFYYQYFKEHYKIQL